MNYETILWLVNSIIQLDPTHLNENETNHSILYPFNSKLFKFCLFSKKKKKDDCFTTL